MSILAVIPARGGSKGIQKKNIATLAGRPLIHYSIEAALASERIDEIVVSTDCPEIQEVVSRYDVACIARPAELATDTAASHDAILHAVRYLGQNGVGYEKESDFIVTLQPTSPLRRAHHIDEAISQFEADSNLDSLVSCVAVPHQFHPKSLMIQCDNGYLKPYLFDDIPKRRQDKELLFARNGAAIYLTKGHMISKFIFGGRLGAYMMCPRDSIDIDTVEDLARAEYLLLNPGAMV